MLVLGLWRVRYARMLVRIMFAVLVLFSPVLADGIPFSAAHSQG